jgi:hypothetical protein
VRVGQERESHPGRKRARGSRHEVAVRVGNVPPLHRNDLCHDPEERLLEADSDADEDLADNESVDILSAGADDAANKSDGGADDEEPCKPLSAHLLMSRWSVTIISPSSSEYIRQLANHEESDGAQHQVRESHPEDIWGRSDVFIDLCQDW